MQIIKKNEIYLVLAVFLSLASCRDVVILESPNFNLHPTLNSFLISGEPLFANVSFAEMLDTDRINFVNEAQVKLFNNGQFIEELMYIDTGYYKSNTFIEPDNEYTCRIKVKNYDEIFSKQYIPQFPIINRIEHINVAGKDEEGTTYPAVKITFKNLLNVKTYYEIEIRVIKKHKDNIEVEIVDWESIIDPIILNEGIPIPLFSNEMMTDSMYTLHLNYTTNSASSRNGGAWRTQLFPLVVELRQVTEDYYRYKKQLYLYQQGRFADGIITSMTNANLYSNVHNGYGIFAGYSATVSDIITPNLE